MYRVSNKLHGLVILEDSDIENYINSGEEIRCEIVQAMGMSHREEYLKYLYPVLYHEEDYMRRDAAWAIFNLNGKKSLPELKKREAMIEEEDLQREPSEKGMLRAMILRLEEGIEATKSYFLSEGYSIIKYDIHACYGSGYPYQEEDIDLLCFLLEHTVNKSADWIRKLSRTDYVLMIYFTLESISYAGAEMDLLCKLNDDLSERICALCESLMAQRISNDTKELIAQISQYMKEEYAKRILRLLKDHVKGDAKRAYKKALKKWQIEEEEL